MNDFINNALTKETPGKVLGLVGVAMFSLAFMLAVSMGDASFSKVYTPLANPFSMDNVVASIDSAAASYDRFLYANLFQPAEESYAFYSGNLSWVADNSGLTYALGLGAEQQTQIPQGRVAGATTYNYTYAQEKTGGVFGLILDAITQ